MKSISFSFVLLILLLFSVTAFTQNKPKVKSNNGLTTLEFDTPKGKVTVHLPENIHAGDVISGTVTAKAKGKNKKQKEKNKNILNGYVIEIEKGKKEKKGGFKWKLPESVDNSFKIILKDLEKIIGKIELPMSPINEKAEPPDIDQSEFQIPPYFVKGQTTMIHGPFDGNFNNTRINFNEIEIPLIAESQRSLHFEIQNIETGQVDFHIEELKAQYQQKTNVIDFEIGIDRLNLKKGEEATIFIEVFGLEGLDFKPVFELKNLSSNVTLVGGNEQHIILDPSSINENKILLKEIEVIASSNGTFSITAKILPYQF